MKIDLITYLFDPRGKELEELGIKIKEEFKEVRVCIDLNEVEAIRETIDDTTDEIDTNICAVMMRSGDSFVVKKSYNELLKLWKDRY